MMIFSVYSHFSELIDNNYNMLVTTKFLSLVQTLLGCPLIFNCLSYWHLKLNTSHPPKPTTYTLLPLSPSSENGTIVIQFPKPQT